MVLRPIGEQGCNEGNLHQSLFYGWIYAVVRQGLPGGVVEIGPTPS